jgi:microcystin-dependent protein
MPSDANGVYSLPNGYLAVTGETIQASQHNPSLEDLGSAMSARLMRSGAAPMTGPLKTVDGSVGSPAIQFNSDGTTGVYKTPNGIGVSVAGVKVAEFVSGGIKGARFLGELIVYSGLTAQSLTVFPYGQTLSRATYADLWAFAQTEIASGNTFYNNGDGSTTFGIGDMRGRVPAGKDDMGGTAANRLTTASGFTPTTIGASGGVQLVTLSAAQLPVVTPSFTGTQGTVSVTSTTSDIAHSGSVGGISSGSGTNAAALAFSGSFVGGVNSSGLFTPSGSVSSFGGGGAHGNVQPTMICNYLLFAGA